jgi:DNA-binding transcriptional LysR family regulator
LRMGYPGAESRPVTGPDLVRRIYAAVPSDAYRSPATDAMIEVLRTIAAEFQGRSPSPAVVS